MPLINVEGVGLINFDDSMSREQITQAIERDILPQIRNSRQVSDEPMGPDVPQRAPQPTAESTNRSALERNITDPLERGYQNLMLGIGALRARSPESFYGLSPEDAAKDIAERLRRLQEIPRTEASQRAFEEAAKTESVAGAVGRLGQSSSALGDIAAESFGSNPLAAPVGVLANVTPVPVLRQLIGALAGALNFPTEFATSMGDSLLKAAQDQGVDPSKPEQLAQLIRAVNEDPELKQKMRDDALTRASIISSVDALAGYGAGRLVTRGAAGRIGGGAAIEGGGGGVGEAAAQLATEGKIDPVEVAAEILGGGAMGAAGNIRRSPIPPERGENEELRSAIGDIVANRPAEPEAPLALPRERPAVDFPGGMLTRTQAENYLVGLEERFPELRFVGGGTEDARGDFDTRLRYARVKLQEEQERVQQGFQQQQEALIRNELAFSPETEEAFRLAELQRQTGIRPDEEALGPIAEIRSAERRLARFEEDFADTRRELSTAQNRRVVDAVEVEGLRDSLADLRQKIAEEQRNIADLRSEIPESQRGITQRENLNLSAQEAFDVAQQRAGRAGPSVTDLRAGAPEAGRPRMVLNPQFDKNNRLVGGEGIVAITGVTPEGTVFATVNREVNGVVQEVPVETNPDNIYSFPMRETARSTQESIAARVGPEQVAGKRGAGVDPRGQSLTPRRVTDRTSQIPETQEEFRPDWRLGEQVGAAPEMPATAPLPQNVKELLAAMRRGKAQPKGQISLVQQLIKGGGLRDTGGEILQFLGGKATNRPGLINRAKRTIVMKGGKPAWKGGFELDQAAEYLAGAKYFTDIPTDEQLLNAIDEELSERSVNYGPTEDIRGQELFEAARQLDREMSIAGVSLQDSDEDIARALGFEAEAQPRTLEDIEREDEARRIAFSARSVGEKADTEAQAEAKEEQEPPNLEKAQAIVKKFLDDLRAKGKTGRLLANALEAALKNKKFNANQIYEAFMIHEALLKTMPKGANYQFRFLEDIVITEAQAEAARASGAKVGDRAQGLIEPPTESLPGFVNISLAEDMLPILRETGAHEAFHVLQDYFAAYDQSFGKQIDKHFKDDMTIDELEPSIKRRLQIMKTPGSNVTYWQSLKSGVGDNKISAKEAQAYAFGALLDASNRGQKIVGLTAPIQRFFNFTKDFFSALRSGFRGDGFRTPASLLTSATERAASFEQQAPKSGGASFSARAVPKEIMDDYEAFSKDLGGAPVVYADKNVALIEAVNASGEPVYVGVNYDKGRRTVFDIDGRDSNLFTKDQLDLLRKEKQSKIKRDEDAFKKNPNGPFVGTSKFASTDNMPKNLSGFGEGLVRLLGMNDIKVFFVSDKDTTKANDFISKYNLFGPYSRAREGFIKTGNYGTMYPSQQNKFYAIKIKSGLRPSMQMETMGHEVGHVFKEVALNTAPKETVDGILNAHAKWYQKNKGGSVRDYVSLMRPLVMGKVTINEAASSLRDRPASELANFYSYWSSFDEWFADQVARWATTSERPQSLIDKFFARIAAAYRKIVNALSDAGIPDQTVANFIESYIDGKLTEKAPSTKMKAGDQLSLFAAKPEERFSARKVTDRDPVLEEAARGVRDGTVSREQYENLVNERKPVTPYEKVPEPATRQQIVNALQGTDPRKVEKIGVPSETLERGDMVGLRLDIPAYSKKNTWVVSVHDAEGKGFYAGTSIGYEPTAIATNVEMGVVPKAAMKIAAGETDKATIAVMRGEWEPATAKEAKARADKAINSPDWVQVGMDPRRHQYFYDRTTREPVVAADEVIQVGPLVLAKNPTYGKKSDYQFSARQAPEARLASRKPSTQNAAAKTFYQSVIADADKIGLLDRVLSTLFDKKKGESVGSAIARTSVNRASALYNADQMAAGNGYTGRSAGKAMEMALTNSGRIAQMLSHGMGKIDAVTGIISRRTDVKPLLTIMREAGVKTPQAKNELQVYLAALRERDLRKNGRKGFLDVTDAAVLDAIKDAETKHPNWKQTAAEMDKFNNALIDWAVDTGIIGKRQAQNLRDVFYTPFYRVMEKDTTTEPSRSVTPRIGESFTNVASAINRELGGGERPLGNLFDNIIMNADSIMKAGLKNLAMKTASETMEFAKLGQKNTTGTRKENTITYKVDGKDIAFDVEDPVLFSALAGMPRTMQSGIYNTMAKMASVFRDFVTVAPSFIFSNLYKGKISAYVQEGQPFMTNTFAGLRDAYNASTSLQNFQLQTGFGGMEYGMAPRDMAKVFERKLTDEGMMKAMSQLKLWSAIRQGFGKMREISEASEMAERIKLAENLINKGMKQEDAYFQAYLLAPYSRRGTGEGWLGSTIQFLMPLVPFLNAKVQTTYRLVENEKGDKRKLWTLGLPQQIFLRGLVLTGFSMLTYGLNLEDDEEKWDKIPPYMKLNYDIIPFMGNYITLPRAFEIGQIFGALPIFVLDAIRRGEGKDLAEALVEVGKNTFWMNPIPKAIDPILGAFTNYDFFRGRPLETKGEQALPVGERINRSTTKTGEALAGTVNMVFGNVLSPIKAQALLDGYTGTLGVALMNGFDSLLAAAGAIPGKPAGAFGDPASMPGILANFAGMNRFYREDAQMVSRFVGDFYKIKEMTDQLVRSQNLARQAGDFTRLQELRGEEGLPLQMRSAVNAASEQISDLNKRIRLIERRDIDAVAKAEQIEPLIKRRDDIAKRVVDRARNIGAF